MEYRIIEEAINCLSCLNLFLVMMLKLAGYQEVNQIYAGNRTLVYRGIQTTTQQPVIIKVLRNPHPNFQELVRFRNQYIITRNLEHPAIVQPLTLERYFNGYALVMPDNGALSLLEYWQQYPSDLSQFLSIALQLAEALNYLGQNRIIHKDIKPTNILIHPETCQIQLIDFSISSLLPKEQQQLVNPNVLEGTLAYISPEQTGRMNRGIDYRTDFYSLGVTLYEILTGIVPFQSSDPMELLHCHIAKAPLAPNELLDNQGQPYPEAISEIILKLMAKNAEERYQSILGLKYDLERCLQQWEATGEITPFDLGENDRSDRFIIPEKLYGREAEVQVLLDAFERVANPRPGKGKNEWGNELADAETWGRGDAGNGNPTPNFVQPSESPLTKGGHRGVGAELLLVAGFSGIGKTAVVNEVHKPIISQRGYFIKGKFDQLNRNVPFWAFVQAFRDLMGQLVSESDADLANWKAKILNALGDNAQVIIDVVPELERIVGKQLPAPELSGSAAQNRFNLLFQKFIAVFTTQEHPLVIFLDDLQWADSASLNLMQVLMGDSDRGYLLLLGAYRDNEVFPAHPLMLSLKELEKKQAALSTITLNPLVFEHINKLIADTLSCPENIAQPLTELVYQKTQGNPFFTTQFLKGLHQDELITFNQNLGYWECDLVQVQDAALTDDVVEFMAGRLQKLPEATQEVLKIAACIGNRFDLATLAVVDEQNQEDVATNLWRSLQEGFVIPTSETYKFFQGEQSTARDVDTVSVSYQFLHDRIQQAAYNLIPEEQKTTYHYQIGRNLLVDIPLAEQEEFLFEIVNHLNTGIALIIERGERYHLSQLNLQASRKAKTATAYQSANGYCDMARSLITEETWQTDYQNHLEIYLESVEIAFLCGEFDHMEHLAQIVLQEVRQFLDGAKVYEIQAQALIAQNQLDATIQLGLNFLEKLGIQLPSQVTPSQITTAFAQNDELLQTIVIEDVVNFDLMDDPNKEAAVRMITIAGLAMYVSNPELLMLAVAKQVNLCLQYGNTSTAADAYATYGLFLCGEIGDIEQGYRFGKLAVNVLERFQILEIKSLVYVLFYGSIKHWKDPCQDTIPDLQNAYHYGLETGDLQNAALSAYFYCVHKFLCGFNLQDLHEETQRYSQAMQSIKQRVIQGWLAPFMWSTAQLTEPYTESVVDEQQALDDYQQASDRTGVFVFAFHKIFLAYFLEQYEVALKFTQIAQEYLDGATGMAVVPCFYFYQSLVFLSQAIEKNNSIDPNVLAQIKESQQKLHQWSQYAASNFQHKYDLVEAQLYRVQGNLTQSLDYYDRAIAGARANSYLQEEALANELAAKFYLDWGKETIATTYMQEAYYCYARWGAKAKTDQLEEKYPQLLSSIMQKQPPQFNPFDSLTNLTESLNSSYSQSIDNSNRNSSSTIIESFDIFSVLQAAQSLSRTIELDQLLNNIVQIIMFNAGVQKTVLLIPQAEQWQLRAMAQLTDDGIVEINRTLQPLTQESSVPIRVIQYVKHTLEPLLINEGQTEISGILEGYVLNYQPQSILCVPLLNQGQLVAIVYLEHPTTKGVFTPNRLAIIQFLCAQAAVSLQNAQLYNQAQQAIQELHQTQRQLAQSEKMSNLRNLVAGVTHEINQPVSFLQGNIQPALNYMQNLLDLISLYQSEYPQPNEKIQAKIEAIDLEFIREYFPRLLESMHQEIQRIRNISNNLVQQGENNTKN
ncbi:MAG: AAA family ATPase [Symploca sp. SIO1B1]|nr:AAA family ATPase [Symploca sp. SIO1B1]